jgi:pimeloyl-ACP methyl ester carboxylesterase
MKIRNLLGLAVGTVGATALANKLLTAGGADFEQFLSGEEREYRWRGFDAPYVEAGDPEDPDVVLLHGINAAASNHEFSAVFERLAEDYHVVAPDLPGFGHADRPPLLYSSSLLTSFVTDFLGDVPDDDPTVVASSLTGSYAAKAVQDVEVKELVLICPTDDTGPERGWARTVLRMPLVGTALFNVITSKRSLRRFHADHGYADVERLAPEVLEYEWATAHQPGARYAPASFVAGFLDPKEPLDDELPRVNAPVTLVWGRESEMVPLSEGHDLAEIADARLVVFDNAKLLPHVEHPAEFVEVVQGKYAEEPVSPEV